MNSKPEQGGRGSKEALRTELGRRIVEARSRRGWSQAELARRLGVPRERLGKWERGLNAPSLEDLSALSEVLEVPLERLGLGRAGRPAISDPELAEMVVHLGALARLLKPWRDRQGAARAGRRKKEE